MPEESRRIEALEQRVAALEVQQRVVELRARYAWHAARGDFAAVARELFTADGVFDGPGEHGLQTRSVYAGREALAAGLSGLRPLDVLPLVVNHTVAVDGDRATGTCAMHSPVPFGGADAIVGYYYDTCVRDTDGEWRFARREFHLYFPRRAVD